MLGVRKRSKSRSNAFDSSIRFGCAHDEKIGQAATQLVLDLDEITWPSALPNSEMHTSQAGKPYLRHRKGPLAPHLFDFLHSWASSFLYPRSSLSCTCSWCMISRQRCGVIGSPTCQLLARTSEQDGARWNRYIAWSIGGHCLG